MALKVNDRARESELCHSGLLLDHRHRSRPTEQCAVAYLLRYSLVYGTYLYTDFPTYNGAATPYIGSGIYLVNKNTGALAGHCMLIIGYNDAYAGPDGSIGAVCIQNSFGSDWGSDGYVWMAYPTFQAMAQGTAFYIAA